MSPVVSRSPARARLGLVAATVATLLVPAAAAAQAPDRIDLPDGWQPEGITTDGASLFAGSLADGAVWKGDPATGIGDVFVPGEEGSVAVGLDVDRDHGRLWVAGGPTGEVRAYDSDSGELLGAYPFEAGFLNDLAVTPEAVYITDSFMPQVLVVPLAGDGTLPDPGEAFALPISGELTYGDGFNVNGIVATEAGLVVVHSGTGELYRLDPATGEASGIDTGGLDLTAGDGLELDDSILYVVRNRANLVVVLELADDATAVRAIDELSSDDLAVPTTAAIVGDDLWVVNARFGTGPTPETAYWMSRVDAPVSAEG